MSPLAYPTRHLPRMVVIPPYGTATHATTREAGSWRTLCGLDHEHVLTRSSSATAPTCGPCGDVMATIRIEELVERYGDVATAIIGLTLELHPSAGPRRILRELTAVLVP